MTRATPLKQPSRALALKMLVLGGVILLAVAVLFTAAYTLHETEQAVVVQFGNPVREVTGAGLYFKVPLIQEIRRFDKRVKAWDGDPNEIPTQGGEFIWVDTTARWRIVRPQLFMESVRDEASALSRLSDIIDSVVRDQIAGTQLVEIVRSSDWGKDAVQELPPKDDADAPAEAEEEPEQDEGQEQVEQLPEGLAEEEIKALTQHVEMGRQELTRRILARSRTVVEEYGIELVDVQIKRINYVSSVQEQVFQRMISDQQRRAEEYRSEGAGESARILGETRRELAEIQSQAEYEAQVIRGEADAEATRIYNEAYSTNARFYALYRTLESYGQTIDDKTILLLGTDSDYYRFLRRASP